MTGDADRRLLMRKASAGSGKTYQLAYNFIRYTLGRRTPSGQWQLCVADGANRHRHILAITFTNKATDEMKHRIVRELAILAQVPMMEGRETNYLKDLADDFGLSLPADRELIRRAAKSALYDLLFDYSEFNVSTIDAFFQSVLRSFAFEADLSGNYDVTLDSESLFESGISETLKQVVEQKSQRGLMSWLQSFMELQLRLGNSFNLLHRQGEVRKNLRLFMESLTDEHYMRHAAEIDGFLARSTPGAPNPVILLQQAVVARRDALVAEMTALASDLCADFNLNEKDGYKAVGLKSTFASLVKKISSGSLPGLTESSAKALSDVDYCFTLKATPDAALVSGMARLLEGMMMTGTLDEILRQIHSFGLFDAINTNINRIKADTNTILLSDTNTLLRRIIKDSPSPFIYERTGMKLHHFLVDEFQDTSRLQWENLRPLLIESLGSGYDNLIIGDVKQCIYRFRNSDPMLLGHELENDSEISGHIALDSNNVNYRSAREIVEFNYDLFSWLGQATGNAPVYEPESKDAVRRDAPRGYVSVRALPPESFVADAKERMLAEMLRQLDPERGNYRPRDIAVLVRTNNEASEIIDYLTEQFASREMPVRVVGDDSLLLVSSQAVRRVIAELRRYDTLPVATSVKENSYTRVSPDQLEWFAAEFDSRRRDNPSDADPFQTLTGLIGEFDRLLDENPDALTGDHRAGSATSLISLVNSLTGLLPDDLRRHDSAYIYALMDLVVDYCRSGIASVHGFLDWWDRRGVKCCISASPSNDAISVMTVHKSKGLEFDCVHVPVLNGNLGKEISLRWYDCGEGDDNVFRRLGIDDNVAVPRYFPVKSNKNLAYTMFASEYETLLADSRLDELNAVYVAFTRPVRELIVSVKGIKVSTDKKSARQPDPFNIGNLLAGALGCRSDLIDGSWEYHLGESSRRIAASGGGSSAQPDRPQAVEMPCYEVSDGILSRIDAYITDSLFAE